MTAPARSPLDRLIARLRRRAFVAVFLADLARALLVLLGVSGALVLLLRVLGDFEPRLLALLFLPALAAPVWAWKRARARTPDTTAAATWLDVRTGSTGFLVAGAERADPRWQETVETLARRVDVLPTARTSRPAMHSVAALGFAAAALFLELPSYETEPLSTRLFEGALERLAHQLTTLEENSPLAEDTAAELQERLARLGELVEEGRAEALFEGMDRLGESLERSAREALEEGGTLLEAFAGAAAGRSPAELAALAQQLGESVGLDLEALQSALNAEGLELPEGLQLDPADVSRLARLASGLLRERMGRLSDVGLLDREALRRALENLDLSEILAEHVCDSRCLGPGGT